MTTGGSVCLYARVLCLLLIQFAFLANVFVVQRVHEQLKSNHNDMGKIPMSLTTSFAVASSSERKSSNEQKTRLKKHSFMSVAHLPQACRTKPQPTKPDATATLKLPNRLVQIARNLEVLPPEYVHNQPIQPLDPLQVVGYVAKNDNDGNRVLEKRYGAPMPDHPVNLSLICFPHGIFMDSTIAGPLTPSFAGKNATIYLIEQNKRWFPKEGILNKTLNITVVQEYPGLGVQLSGWTTHKWNHFALDTLLRLGLVFEALMSNDPLWGNAKIIVANHPFGRNDIHHLDAMSTHVFERLNLTHRLVFNNGWAAKANWTKQFEFLAMPDYTPLTVCGNRRNIHSPIFPRHIMAPVQAALGLTGDTKTNTIVYAGRKEGGRRAVDMKHKELLLQSIRDLLKELNLGDQIHVVEWSYSGKPAETMEVFRRAAVVMGPHGGQLWNAALSPPGGLLMEFNSWYNIFVDPKDCRTYGLSLANAAGLSYAIIDTPNFGYENHGLKPNIEQEVDFLRSFLTKGKL